MKSVINQLAFGTIDTNGTNGTKLNANCATNVTCATCQLIISENERLQI